MSFNVIISSSKALSLLFKSLIVYLIWLISHCKSCNIISFCLFLNLSKVLDKLIMGLSCFGLWSLLGSKDFNLSVYFCFNWRSSYRPINSIRAVSSWFCLIRTVICLIGLKQILLHPNSMLLAESSLGKWYLDEVLGLSKE